MTSNNMLEVINKLRNLARECVAVISPATYNALIAESNTLEATLPEKVSCKACEFSVISSGNDVLCCWEPKLKPPWVKLTIHTQNMGNAAELEPFRCQAYVSNLSVEQVE